MQSRPHLRGHGTLDRRQLGQCRLHRVPRPAGHDGALFQDTGQPLEPQRDVSTQRAQVLGVERGVRETIERVTAEAIHSPAIATSELCTHVSVGATAAIEPGACVAASSA